MAVMARLHEVLPTVGDAEQAGAAGAADDARDAGDVPSTVVSFLIGEDGGLRLTRTTTPATRSAPASPDAAQPADPG